MALTGTITIHGATAGAVFHDHGAINLSPFTKFSAFLSDQFSFGSTSYSEIDSASLTLKSKFGNLVVNNNDTVSASYGGDTVISGSVGINFVFGSTTTSLFSTPYSDTLPGAGLAALGNTSLTGAVSALSAFESELLKPTTSATVPAAIGATAPDLAVGPAATQLNLGDAKVNLVSLHKPTTDKG